MRADDDIGLELFQVPHELVARIAGERAAQLVHLLRDFRMVRLAEDHAPQFRREFDEFYIAVLVDFFVERREKFHEVETLDEIFGTRRAPRFFHGRRRRYVSAARRNRRDENPHDGRLPEPETLEKREFHWQFKARI